MLTRVSIVLLYLGLIVHTNSHKRAPLDPVEDDTTPSVMTITGGLKGYYAVSQNGRSYETYEGIPYAMPPINDLRFEPPQQINEWDGYLSATELSPACIQFIPSPYIEMNSLRSSEDCLYLNIYVPVRKTEHKKSKRYLDFLPVLFWIHDGAFQHGKSNVMIAKYLMDYDVILVTFNYRLGIFGFLSTEDEIVPGNMGLKDQNMALRWVSENIISFGGDPKRITLIGLDAGGASVHYHYLSNMSRDLFQGGISMSGTALNSWAQTENSLEKVQQLSMLLGCFTVNTTSMIQCLRYSPVDVFERVTKSLPFLSNSYVFFGPVSEKYGDTPFINKEPIEIFNTRDVYDVPWITGIVSQEGLYSVGEFINSERHLQQLEENWEIIAPDLLDFRYTIPQERHDQTASLIKYHYFGGEPIGSFTTRELIQVAGDRLFVVDSEKAARTQSIVNKSPVWYYYYSYRGKQSLSDVLSKTMNDYGVCHGDDAFTVLNTPWINPTMTQEDREMQKHLIELWVSFATNKTPSIANVEWEAVNPLKHDFYYLHIARPTNIEMKSNDNFGDKEFWHAIKFSENGLKYESPGHIFRDEL